MVIFTARSQLPVYVDKEQSHSVSIVGYKIFFQNPILNKMIVRIRAIKKSKINCRLHNNDDLLCIGLEQPYHSLTMVITPLHFSIFIVFTVKVVPI